ncbi:MAG: hypothetical protein K8W52_05590 [Deltaproteobacteria bacterium]|nr:hypothetical protein [Deltaproteobacteria bacterium]
MRRSLVSLGLAVAVGASGCAALARTRRVGTDGVAPASPAALTEAAAPATASSPPAPPPPRPLPAPHRAPRPRAGQPGTPPDGPLPRAWIGVRDGREPLAFALALRAELVGDRWDATDGPALVAAARSRGLAIAPASAARELRPGALVVFDRAVKGAPASLVALVTATDGTGVADLMFLAAGVVRAGKLDLAHPTRHKDDRGRVVNTYLRHREDPLPDGTRFLAGELAALVIPPP